MIRRIITGVLGLLTLLSLLGFVLSFVILVFPSGCSDGDVSCSVGADLADEGATYGVVLFGVVSLATGFALLAWRSRDSY